MALEHQQQVAIGFFELGKASRFFV